MKAGQKIRKIRDLKGFSQEYMALRLNMSQTNYSKIESDEVKLIVDRLMEIGDIFGMDPLDILSFDKELIFNNHDQKGGQAGNIITSYKTYQNTNAPCTNNKSNTCKKRFNF